MRWPETERRITARFFSVELPTSIQEMTGTVTGPVVMVAIGMRQSNRALEFVIAFETVRIVDRDIDLATLDADVGRTTR